MSGDKPDDEIPPEQIIMLVGGTKGVRRGEPAAPKPDSKTDDDGGVGSKPTRLPDDCPVEPLGVAAGEMHYLDALRQHRVLAAGEHGRLGLMALFSPHSDYLCKIWPRYRKDGKPDPDAWRPELCAAALTDAAARKGIINPSTIRERGAWPGDNGELIWHCGDEILMPQGWQKPGRIGEHIYPAGEKLPRPHEQPDVAAVEELRQLLLKWNWHRGELAAQLLLGWIGAAMLGGALAWRPLSWITGDWSTGKSTLHEVLSHVMGPSGMISVTDTSAAGIFQKLRRSTLPVAIDELENERDNTRAEAVIKLARQACSGGVVLRGGADHRGTEFTARSCFLFSSILLIGLLPQDRSRMAILELDTLVPGKPAPKIDRTRLNEIGRHLRGRLSQQWPRFAETFRIYKDHLPCLSGRGADQFCTLLACADLALNDAAPSDGDSLDALARWTVPLTKMRQADKADEQPDYVRCIEHLLTSMLNHTKSGIPRTVGDWLAQAAGDHEDPDRKAAGNVLAAFGLRLLTRYIPPEAPVETQPADYLAVANTHHNLSTLFIGTHWQTLPGRSGVWRQTFVRVPGALRGHHQKFDAGSTRAVLLPYGFVLDPEGYVSNATLNPNLMQNMHSVDAVDSNNV